MTTSRVKLTSVCQMLHYSTWQKEGDYYFFVPSTKPLILKHIDPAVHVRPLSHRLMRNKWCCIWSIECRIPVRGHCILWDVEIHEPEWLLPMNKTEVEAQVKRRMNYVVGHYKNRFLITLFNLILCLSTCVLHWWHFTFRLPHWDVNNEQLHGDFFENKTGDPDYLTKAFQMAHSIDPSVKLFTNDYSVLASGELTQVRSNFVWGIDHNHCLGDM